MLGGVKVFISWSGDQARSVAETLKGWLETVLAGRVSAWVSSQNIEKGERGLSAIARELETGTFGLVVVTRSNADAPWINFEAGALGKSLGESRVATALVDLTPADISGPLAQFQATALSDRDDVLALVRDIAKAAESGGGPIPTETIDLLFQSKWPELEAAISAASGGEEPTTERPEKEILAEVLELVRGIARDRATTSASAVSTYFIERENEDSLHSQAMRTQAAREPFRFSETVARIRERKMKTFIEHYGGDAALKDGEFLGRIVEWDAGVDGVVSVLIAPPDGSGQHIRMPITEIEVGTAF